MSQTPGGDSAVARQFDASIHVEQAEERGLYLVVGYARSPVAAVTGVGGQVVVQFPGSPKLLAVLPNTAHVRVQSHPDVAMAGPVVIDPVRFAQFVEMAGLNGNSSK